jgi:hypothetical protein
MKKTELSERSQLMTDIIPLGDMKDSSESIQ